MAVEEPKESGDRRGRVLVVDDEEALLRGLERLLKAAGYDVVTARSGEAAIEIVRSTPLDVILTDIVMPGMNGLQLLREIRRHNLDVVVVLATGRPDVESAVEAVEYGAYRYLVKPIATDKLMALVREAVSLRKLAELKRLALTLMGEESKQLGDRASLDSRFQRGIELLWMAVQPIVLVGGELYGYEALLRTEEPTLPHPGAFLDAAEQLGKLNELGRACRDRTAAMIATRDDDTKFFVNLHPQDLSDEHLFSPTSALTKLAHRVVLEITERARLTDVKEVQNRIGRLKALGFKIAVDDLGAGYAGLSSFALLEPEIVKLDMSLVRDVHKTRVKRELVASMARLCRDLDMKVVGEGVETVEERDALVQLDCELYQGYLFARPGRPFPAPKW